MAKKQRKYDMEYKIQAVKLAKEIGGAKAAAELGIPVFLNRLCKLFPVASIHKVLLHCRS